MQLCYVVVRSSITVCNIALHGAAQQVGAVDIQLAIVYINKSILSITMSNDHSCATVSTQSK